MSPLLLGVIKPGRFLSCFRDKEPALGPPAAPPLLPHPRAGDGDSRGHQAPASLLFLPEKEEGHCPEPAAASASWASRAAAGSL